MSNLIKVLTFSWWKSNRSSFNVYWRVIIYLRRAAVTH